MEPENNTESKWTVRRTSRGGEGENQGAIISQFNDQIALFSVQN